MTEQPAATSETTQEALPEMPAAERPKPRWLDVCEAGVVDWAIASLLLSIASAVPGLEDGDADVFERSAHRLAKVVMQEIGRREYETAQAQAEARVDAWLAKARNRAR